jgi:hypothetical protein
MRRVVLEGSSFPTTCARRLRVVAADILLSGLGGGVWHGKERERERSEMS